MEKKEKTEGERRREHRETKVRATTNQVVGKAGRKDGSRGNKRVRHTGGAGSRMEKEEEEEEESVEKGRNKSAPSVKVIS